MRVEYLVSPGLASLYSLLLNTFDARTCRVAQTRPGISATNKNGKTNEGYGNNGKTNNEEWQMR